jgi:hypothetical protein
LLEVPIHSAQGNEPPQQDTPNINASTSASYNTDVTPNATTRTGETISINMKSGLPYMAPLVCNGRKLPDYAKPGNQLQIQNSNQHTSSIQLIWIDISMPRTPINAMGATHGITSPPTPCNNNNLINIAACSNIPPYIDMEKYKIVALLAGSHDTVIICHRQQATPPAHGSHTSPAIKYQRYPAAIYYHKCRYY